MSNLPPGVTESMIPGNRPEDEAYERLWDETASRLRDMGYSQGEVDALLAQPIAEALLDVVADLAYEQGAQEARADRELEEAAEHADQHEGVRYDGPETAHGGLIGQQPY